MRNIKYGILHKDRLFVWIDKELWSYPYEKDNRNYSLKKVACMFRGNKLHYRLGNDWLPMDKLQQMTIAVKVKPINNITDNSLPF